MQMSVPLIRDLVLLGGGHTHALVLRKWGMKPLPGVRLTLINPGPTAPYTGMLPGHIAGHYGRAALEMDLVQLARFAGARLVLGTADGLDTDRQRVRLGTGREIAYDMLSIDIGITSDMPEIPGFADHGVAAKPLGGFAARWEAYVPRVVAGERPASAAVIGGGIAGVELAFALHHRLLTAMGTPPTVQIIDDGGMLRGSAASVRRALKDQMRTAGITMHENAAVAQVTPDSVILADGTELDGAFCVGAAGARPQGWLAGTGLALQDGYISVGDDLRAVGNSAIYATGDCAHFSHAPRPKAGVFAVRAAPLLYHNLRADLTGAMRRRFNPQSNYLKLISLGGQQAIAERGKIALTAPRATPALWRWKDRIDRAFMQKFHRLPDMPPAPIPGPVVTGLRAEMSGGTPLCGGCGAKVAGGLLDEMLGSLDTPDRPDIETGPGDDAAILRLGTVRQTVTTDHLRAFVEDPDLMARIAAQHALGDIWAMGATPQAALTSLTLPRMSRPLQSRTLAEIMQAANAVFAEVGATIVGGHTSMGAELSIGFTLTGLLDRAAVSLTGAQPGDALVLTRPIGTGTLLAAEMQGRADGRDVAALYDIMATSQKDVAASLAPVATAMTDVTGFGLLGHARAMALASGVSIDIESDAVPLYPGALTLSERGVRSTLYPDNLADTSPMVDGWTETARTALLLDPQTCGGLLAAVPAEAVASLGQGCVQIGQIRAGRPGVRLV